MKNYPFIQTLIVPLINASVDRDFIVADTDEYRISVVRVTDAQKERWDRHPRVKFSMEPAEWMLSRATTAIQLEARYGQRILERSHVNEALFALMSLLNVRLPYALWTPFADWKQPGHKNDERTLLTLAEQRAPTEIELYAMVTVPDFRVFRRYWRTITGSSAQSIRLRTSVARFTRARASYFSEDAIVHSFIGMEALFADHTTEAGKIVNKVTRRLTGFILDPDASSSVQDLVALSTRAGQLYKLRHDILHGGLPEESKLGTGAKDAIELLRTSVLIALEEGFVRLKDLAALAEQYDRALQAAQRQEKRRARSAKPKP